MLDDLQGRNSSAVSGQAVAGAEFRLRPVSSHYGPSRRGPQSPFKEDHNRFVERQIRRAHAILWVTTVVPLQFLNISVLNCKAKVDFGILTPQCTVVMSLQCSPPPVTTDKSVSNDVILLLLMKSSVFFHLS